MKRSKSNVMKYTSGDSGRGMNVACIEWLTAPWDRNDYPTQESLGVGVSGDQVTWYFSGLHGLSNEKYVW